MSHRNPPSDSGPHSPDCWECWPLTALLWAPLVESFSADKSQLTQGHVLSGISLPPWRVNVRYKNPTITPETWEISKRLQFQCSPWGQLRPLSRFRYSPICSFAHLLPFLFVHRGKSWGYPDELRFSFPGNMTATLTLPNCYSSFLVFLDIMVRNGGFLGLTPSHLSSFFSLGNLKGWDYKRFHLEKHSESTSCDYKARQSSVYN